MLGFAPLVRDAKVDERRSDAPVTAPILHIGDVPVRVRQMHADRVPQDVNMAAVGGKVRRGRIGVEEPIDLAARKRLAGMAAAT